MTFANALMIFTFDMNVIKRVMNIINTYPQAILIFIYIVGAGIWSAIYRCKKSKRKATYGTYICRSDGGGGGGGPRVGREKQLLERQ